MVAKTRHATELPAMSSTCTPIVSRTSSSVFLKNPTSGAVSSSEYLLIPAVCPPIRLESYSLLLNNHLRNTLSAQRLTRSKLLLLQPSQRIERSSDKQHHRRRNQACRVADEREPLYDAHDAVDGGAHVVCLEASDEAVEVL
jgi:hypothetical protein